MMRICSLLSFLIFLFVIACDSGIQTTQSAEFALDKNELIIPLPSENNYVESTLRLTNIGGADVIITSLTLTEDDDSRELSLLDAEGRVFI